MYYLRLMFVALWPTAAIALLFVLVGIGLFSIAVHEINERENAPCEHFKNHRARDVPVRCLTYFQERK